MSSPAILVTGGAGYIGSHVVRQLGEAGEKVIVLDNLGKGFRQAVTAGELVVGDVGDYALVSRLMAEHGLRGVVRSQRPPRTTIADPKATRPADLVDRHFAAFTPNQLWVADFTYCPTWTGMVHVAFVFDVFSRRILGWRAATSMTTPLVLDCLEQAIWTRKKEGTGNLTGLVHHNDAGSQYTSVAFTDRLVEAGIDASVGSVGDAYDNALAESQIGVFKSELFHPHGPWRDRDQLEPAVLDWVEWFNTDRTHRSIDDLTPIAAEQLHHRYRAGLAEAS